MRISRISDRLRVDRFCIVANSPTITTPINPFSRCATEWRRGNSGCRFPVSEWNSGDTSCWLRHASGRWFLFVEYLLVCLVFPSLRLFLANYERIVSSVSYHFTRFYLALFVCKKSLVIQFSLISTYTTWKFVYSSLKDYVVSCLVAWDGFHQSSSPFSGYIRELIVAIFDK